MKKYFKNVVVVTFASVLFTNCSKDDNSTPATSNYGPSTNGSNWTYSSTEGNSAATPYKLTATNKDTVANSRTYKVFTNSAGPNSYMTKIGSDYFRLASFPTIGISNFEDHYLIDNKAVNESWTSTASFKYANIPFNATLNYTIKEKGITRTVATKAYNNVIHVRLDLTIEGIGAVGGGDFYYAEGVGMIDDLIAITPPALLGMPNYNLKQELTAYEIK